jgi:hypothetical protein
MREIRTLRATRRGLETWNGRDTGPTGAPVLDPTCAEVAQRCASPRDNGCSVRSTMIASEL